MVSTARARRGKPDPEHKLVKYPQMTNVVSATKQENIMYRIQAFNTTGQFWVVETCKYMHERDEIVSAMRESGEYNSISFEWLARC